ncbi:MAG: hypothetical protein RL329_1738 [Bacteroidota bacterium]
MLIQYSVKNYKCFKEEAQLSMVASNYDRDTLWEQNVIPIPKFNLNLLRSAVIYGANASGKSKILEALSFMRSFILSSSKDKQMNELIETQPFRLNPNTKKEPSFFEMNFILDNELYRYGFEVTAQSVVSEWLFHRPHTKEVELFMRDHQVFEVHRTFKKAKFLVENKMVRNNALLLSVAAQFNDQIAEKIMDWIRSLNIFMGLQEHRYTGFSIGWLNEQETKKDILQFMKGADWNIEDLKPVKMSLDSLPNQLPAALKTFISQKIKDGDNELFSDVSVMHKQYDDHKNWVDMESFSLDDDESSGTKKYFAFSAPLLATLQKGKMAVIDELDAKLHPNLTAQMIAAFHSKLTNPLNAQLLFNTHDTHLLNEGLFRRDQIWFTEKDRYGAATLFSLDRFRDDEGNKPRLGEDYERNYIRGKYGAVPYLGPFNSFFTKTERP